MASKPMRNVFKDIKSMEIKEIFLFLGSLIRYCGRRPRNAKHDLRCAVRTRSPQCMGTGVNVLNSFAPGRFGGNFKIVISERILRINFMHTFL